jgi:hypothetical protein
MTTTLERPVAKLRVYGSEISYSTGKLEDDADEWLWRPALHYRWSYRADALLDDHGCWAPLWRVESTRDVPSRTTAEEEIE